MSAADWGGCLALVGWFAWSVAWAATTRLALLMAARRWLKIDNAWAVALTYLALPIILVGSFLLHGAVFGPVGMYGVTPREAFSLVAYLLAPFGLPLLVGGFVVLMIDLGRTALTGFARGHTA